MILKEVRKKMTAVNAMTANPIGSGEALEESAAADEEKE